MTQTTLADAYLRSILRTYRMYKDLGERRSPFVARSSSSSKR